MLRAHFIIIACLALVGCEPTPEEALEQFYAQSGDGETAEDQFQCVLVRVGPPICPLLVREITDPDMTLRRYGIGAVGSIGCAGAVEPLLGILRDKDEPDYIRADALEAIWLIEPDRLRSTLSELAASDDALGSAAKRLAGGEQPDRMTRAEAVACHHH